jgi:hypothetical protein
MHEPSTGSLTNCATLGANMSNGRYHLIKVYGATNVALTAKGTKPLMLALAKREIDEWEAYYTARGYSPVTRIIVSDSRECKEVLRHHIGGGHV